MSSRVRELTFTIDTLSDVDLSGVNTTLRHLSTKKRPVEPRHIVDFSAIARPDDRTVILRVTLDEGIFQADTTSPRNGKNFIDTNAPTTATVVMSDALDPNLDGTVTFDGTVINPAYVTLQGDHIISIDLAGGASGTYNAVGGHLLEVSGFSDVEGNPQTQDEVVGWAVDPNASSIDTGDVVPYTANLKTGILRCSRLIMQRGANIEEQLTRYLKQRGLERENIIHQALVTTHKSTLELYVLYLETVNPRLLKSFPNQGSTLSLTNPPTEYFFTYSAPLSLACIQEAGAVTYDGTNIAAESLSLTPDGQTLIVDISGVAGATDAGLHSFEISDICGVDGVAFSAVPTYIDVTVAEVPDGDATAGGVGSNANSFGTIDAGGTAVSATGDDTLVVDGGNGIAISGDNLATSVTVTVTEAEISHDNIADTGTNTHPEIDTTLSTHTTDIATNTSGIATHLADESNPHAVTLEQARTESNALSGQITVGVSPTDSTHVATKGYVDTLVQGISWQAPVLDLDLTTPPVSPTTGDRYIVASPATGDWVGLENSLLEYDGTDWSAPVTLVEGIAAWIEDEDKQYVYNGTAWVKLSNTFDHDNLQNVGTNTHAAIDTHISSTNPHGTGIADLSDSLVPTTNGQTIEWDNDGTAWVVSSYPIISVNGATGTVVLDTDDLVEGTNLFYTDSRARAAISVTGDLAYTQATGVLDYTGPTKADLDIDHLITLSGVVAASDNLGSFTGGIISDDITVKAAIQELETDLVSKADSSSLHDAVTVTGSYDYITLAGQVITVGQVDLAADVTGLLPQASVDGLTTALAGKSDTTHMHAVDDLSDVDVVTVADNEVLQYDSTAGKWQNVTLAYADISGTPTVISTFTNDSGYVTTSGVTSVNGDSSAAVTLDADDISDTSTTNKFITSTELTKLSGIAEGAEVNVNADWDATSGDALISNKPTALSEFSDDLAYDSTDISDFTEAAQDAAALALTAGSNVTIVYTDATNTISIAATDTNTTYTKEDFDVDHLITLSGMAAASDSLGTFTGDTIADTSTVKVALQALETEVETKAAISSLHDAVTVGGSYDYITLSGQVITVGQVDLAADVTGNLPYSSVSGTPTISTFGETLIDDADAAAARTTLGVDAAGADNSTPVTLDDTNHNYLTISSQEITLEPIDLAADVTGLLPYASVAGTPSLGTAAAADTTDFATAAQGTTADSAVQSGDTVNFTGVTQGGVAVILEGDSRLTDNRDPNTHTHVAADITNFNTAADARITNAAGTSIATLVAGKIPSGQIPDLAISQYLGTASNQAALIALTGEVGDWAIRTDENKTYIITVNDGSTFTDWVAISTPTAPVTSVAGHTGVVTLGPTDVGAAPASHQHTLSDITDFNEGDYATGEEGDLAASAVQPADIANFLPSIDEDDMASNSAAHLPTQQSVKAYVTAVNVDTDLGYTASTRVLTSSTGTDVTLPEATTTNSGLMSDTDKTKIDGIATGAEVNVDTDLSYTPSTRELASSTGINVTLPEAGTDPGLMAAADKTKLDGVATGAEVNVQSDWTAGSGDTFIVNKPTALSAFTDDLAYNHDNISDFDAEVNDLADARIGLANLEDLSNVNAGVGWTNGAVLKYSTSGSRWIAVVNSAGVLTADGSGGLSYSKVAHTDLDVAGLTAGDDEKVIKYDHDTTSWVLAAQTGLSDLSDVDTTGVGSGMLLKYNSTSSQFEPQTVSAENLTTNHTGSNYTPNPNNALITSHLAGIDNALGSGGGGGISTIAAATDTEIDTTLTLANDHVLYWNGTDWQNVSLKDVAVGSAKTYGDASATATTDDLNTHLTNIATSVATLGGIGDVDDSLAASGKYLKHDGAGWVASGVEVDTSAVEAFGVFLA